MKWHPISRWASLTSFLLLMALIVPSLGLLLWKSKANSAPEPDRDESNALVFPRTVELGVVPNGTTVPVALRFENRGQRVIKLTNFKPDCMCTNIYSNDHGRKVPIGGELALAPHEIREVLADLRISAEPGMAQSSGLQFRDVSGQRTRSLRMLYTPIARLYTMPKLIALGRIPVGKPITRRVELPSDGSLTAQNFPELRTDESLSARFTPANEADRRRVTTDLPGQSLLGHIDLTLTPREPEGTGEIRTDIQIRLKEDLSCAVEVRAEVESQFAATPSHLVLPRMESGKPRYRAQLFLKSADRTPFDLIEPAEAGLFAITAGQRGEAGQLLPLEAEFTGPIPSEQSRQEVLAVMVTTPTGPHTIRIPVTILPATYH